MRLRFLPGLVVLGLFAAVIGNGAWHGLTDQDRGTIAAAASATQHHHGGTSSTATTGTRTADRTATPPSPGGAAPKVPSAALSPAAGTAAAGKTSSKTSTGTAATGKATTGKTTTGKAATGKTASGKTAAGTAAAGKTAAGTAATGANAASAYKTKHDNVAKKIDKKITPAQRAAAAKRAADQGLKVPAPTPENLDAAHQAGLAKRKGKVRKAPQPRSGKAPTKGALAPSAVGTSGVGAAAAGTTAANQVPHYFGPYANYANSPLRLPDALVTINAVAGDPGTGATAAATVDATGVITAIDVTAGGSGYATAPDVVISGAAGAGSGASATATIDAAGAVTAITVVNGGSGYMTPGIQKFVDTLAGVGDANANDLGQYIPVATPDTTTYPGTDYYEIAVMEYEEKMHRDLPATRLRGYVQLSTSVIPGKHLPLAQVDGTPITINGQQAYAVDRAHYMGPLISATKNRPTRILFRNLLPTGVKGDLFLPVDTSVMGSGMGPNMVDANGNMMPEPDPQNPMCNASPKPAGCYTENRALLHLHGGITPWISDGTPHQWVTPAGEKTDYPKGVSVRNVPDMPDPGPGAETLFYTNQQSARLMFYHDHAWGITRLNVYAGEAAAYTITDDAEKKLISDGTIPGAADTLPLVLQDKTFVPGPEQLALEDPTWDPTKWGGLGQLWFPHVYVPAQNPSDSGGVNPFGRWAYGPWFWPPTTGIAHGPVSNPYYDPNCDAQISWCEPAVIPGTPNNSMGMEAFNDTPVVNGTVYPTLTVDPKSYRLRILNAADDRFFNLQWYQADATGTEVALKASEVAAALTDPTVFPTPDTALSPAGPSWVQIGTSGGFLPTPTVVANQPITWVTDPTVFNAGNVDKHALLLGPAERADAIVDFSQYAGKTLILYNDAPAAFPARDPRYDYYTGNADLTSTGGAPSTPPGYGPNTRTIMQIKVAATPPAAPFDMAKLNAAFAHHTDPATGAPAGVFESSQPPLIVGQGAYNTALGTTFRTAAPRDGFARISDTSLSFNTLLGQGANQTLTMPLQPKAIQDEMGESFDQDYGRMAGMMGLEAPNAAAGRQNLILYPYVNPSTEVINGLPDASTPIATANDGTQIWKITQNGVDTHPVHVHLFDVQLINRVGWDGVIRKPEPSELGWKDTVRVSPLEDTIIALRPQIPKTPFGIVDSIRPLNPMTPIGSPAMFNSVDANGQPMNPPLTNKVVNFGWEYVWHCHILSHEEMDMMRAIVLNVDRKLPDPPVVTPDPNTPGLITWTDGTPVTATLGTNWGNPANEVGYRIERAPVTGGVAGTYAQIGTALANQTSFTDPNPGAAGSFAYRVIAWNAAGDAVSATGPAGIPAAPTGLTASVGAAGPTPAPVGLSWTGSNGATGYTIERASDAGFTTGLVTVATGVTTTQFSDTGAPPSTAVWYRVAATNPTGISGWSNSATVTTPAVQLAVPTLAGTITNGTAFLSWSASANATAYVLTRAENAGFTTNVTQTLVTGATSTTDTTLASGVQYFYRVQASNQWVTTGPSNVVTLALQIPAPANITAKASTSWPLTVTVGWTATGAATGAVVQRSTNPAFTAATVSFAVNGSVPTFTDITVIPSTTYYYRVRSTGVGTPSGWSAAATATTPAVPLAQVTGLAAAVAPSGTAATVLTWPGQPWAAGYEVQRATNGRFTAGLTTWTTGLPTLADTTAAAGTRYFYRVRATQPAAAGTWSPRIVFRPNVPPRATSLTATATATGPGQASVALAWAQNTNTIAVGGFVIERATNRAFTQNLVVVSSTVPAADRTYTDTGLARNTRYFYRIHAVNSYGTTAGAGRIAGVRTPA